jgi:hypothetical protein
MRRPRIRDGFGAFFLLIMSKAQMGIILCKLSSGFFRYERTMDESNSPHLKI